MKDRAVVENKYFSNLAAKVLALVQPVSTI